MYGELGHLTYCPFISFVGGELNETSEIFYIFLSADHIPSVSKKIDTFE